jgi:hypothetical protein
MSGEIAREELRAEVTPGRNQAELIEATLVAASDSFENGSSRTCPTSWCRFSSSLT